MAHRIDTRHPARHVRRALLRVLPGLSVLVFAVTLATSPAHAAATAAVSGSTAQPPAFVPDWDGHTDSTRISYRVVARSYVRVQVLDARGRVVETLTAGARGAGTHQTWWDGRDATGAVMAPGRYRVRVMATPLPAPAGAPGEANAGVSVVRALQDVPIAVQAPAVSIRSLRLTRGSIGAARASATTRASFHLSATAAVSAAVVDRAGRVVRTLVAGRLAAGSRSLAWNGTDARGRGVADGTYSLLLAATGGGRPTTTLRVPLRVDRTAPRVRAARRSRARSSRSAVVVPTWFTIDEAATVTVRLGRRSVRYRRGAGRHRMTIRGTALGIRPGRRARTLRVTIVAEDPTGNRRGMRTMLVVPAVARPTAPVRPPVTTPPPVTPTRPTQGPTPLPPRSVAWPVHGTLTSGFGPRWGRLHAGIDVSAPTGTPILASMPGRVSYVGPMDGYGLIVILEHPNGVQTRYAHMSRTGAVVVGDPVAVGDDLGLVGCTGSCSGPHLHFELRVGGVPVDPVPYLR